MAPDWRTSYASGVAALEQRDLNAAWSYFSSAIDAGADRWEPFYGRAWAVVHGGGDDRRLVEAEKDLDRALDEFGGGADAAALRGEVARRRGDYERAVESFLRAIGRSPQRNLVAEGLAESLAELLDRLESSRDARLATATCDRLIRLLESSSAPGELTAELLAEVHATRAYCRQRDGDVPGAAADISRLAQLAPRHPRLPETTASDPADIAATADESSGEPTFASIGGLDEPGTFTGKLRALFDVYFGQPDLATLRERLAEYGLSPGRRVLLFGPSGCGKTYMIQAFAGEYRRRYRRELPIIRLRLNEVLNRYVGEDEKNLTALFNQAIESQPSILFADEVDAVGMSRESGQDWRIQLTSHLIQELDRVRDRRAAVLFFGATNRVWSVDLALQRRFDRLIPAELPDAATRAGIFAVYLGRMGSRVAPADADLKELAARSHGLTPGDIQKVVSRAVEQLLIDHGDTAERRLTQADLLRALDEYRRPMHVREWVRQSVAALHEMGQDDMAAEVERMYGPFIGGDLGHGPAASAGWRPIPQAAWTESPEFDLSVLRAHRR